MRGFEPETTTSASMPQSSSVQIVSSGYWDAATVSAIAAPSGLKTDCRRPFAWSGPGGLARG